MASLTQIELADFGRFPMKRATFSTAGYHVKHHIVHLCYTLQARDPKQQRFDSIYCASNHLSKGDITRLTQKDSFIAINLLKIIR